MLGVRLLEVRNHWYLVMLQLKRFMIAVARVAVNHDGRCGTGPDLFVRGRRPGLTLGSMLILLLHVTLQVSRVGFGCRFMGVVLLVLMLLLGLTVLAFSANLMFSLELRIGRRVLRTWGRFGVSFLEPIIFFEQWAGHRLLSEKVTRPHVGANRPILVISVLVSEGIEIRHDCQFIRILVRAQANLLGGIGRFLPSVVGSHVSRLWHLGWNQCSHGLTYRPIESCHHQCL